MVFRATYTGWDLWRSFMPVKWQAKSLVKLLLKSTWKGADWSTTDLVVELPDGSFRVIDAQGNVEPCEKRSV